MNAPLRAMMPIDTLPLAGEPGWHLLTETQRRFVAMCVVEGLVDSGGFRAVYVNGCTLYLPLARAGYADIGAGDHAQIIDDVLDTLRHIRKTGPHNVESIEVHDAPWYRLDIDTLETRRADYIARHPEAFPALMS